MQKENEIYMKERNINLSNLQLYAELFSF